MSTPGPASKENSSASLNKILSTLKFSAGNADNYTTMKALRVVFRPGGFLGIGRRAGRIMIADSLEVADGNGLRASRPDVRQRFLEGKWRHFPPGWVSRMRLAGMGCEDNEWNNIQVKGKKKGAFKGQLRFLGNRESTSIRFELFDNDGEQRWKTEFQRVDLQPGDEGDGLAAQILGIRRVQRSSGDDPADITFNVWSVPPRTSKLALYFAGDKDNFSGKEWHLVSAESSGVGVYTFRAAISSEYKFKLGTPQARNIILQFILRALDAKGRPIKHEEIREVFSLDKVET
jgi:hypothetical protein